MTDPQTRTFTDADADSLDETALVDHPEGTLDDLEPSGPIKTVEEYERDGWDVERSGPKTLDEAREDLAARIADPAAPDTEDQASAYDDEIPDDRFADDEEGSK